MEAEMSGNSSKPFEQSGGGSDKSRSASAWNSWPTELLPRWRTKKLSIDATDEEKVSRATADCTHRCAASDRPFHELGKALEEYKNAGWKQAELKEIRFRVVRVLMEQSQLTHSGDFDAT